MDIRLSAPPTSIVRQHWYAQGQYCPVRGRPVRRGEGEDEWRRKASTFRGPCDHLKWGRGIETIKRVELNIWEWEDMTETMPAQKRFKPNCICVAVGQPHFQQSIYGGPKDSEMATRWLATLVRWDIDFVVVRSFDTTAAIFWAYLVAHQCRDRRGGSAPRWCLKTTKYFPRPWSILIEELVSGYLEDQTFRSLLEHIGVTKMGRDGVAKVWNQLNLKIVAHTFQPLSVGSLRGSRKAEFADWYARIVASTHPDAVIPTIGFSTLWTIKEPITLSSLRRHYLQYKDFQQLSLWGLHISCSTMNSPAVADSSQSEPHHANKYVSDS